MGQCKQAGIVTSWMQTRKDCYKINASKQGLNTRSMQARGCYEVTQSRGRSLPCHPVLAFVSFVQKLETYFHNIVVNNMPHISLLRSVSSISCIWYHTTQFTKEPFQKQARHLSDKQRMNELFVNIQLARIHLHPPQHQRWDRGKKWKNKKDAKHTICSAVSLSKHQTQNTKCMGL